MKKVLSITLIRDEDRIDMFDEKRINSTLQVNFQDNNRFKMYRLPVIENRDYIFPYGVYEIRLEYSPKFKKYLWEFKDIPERSEIKFHQGSKPQHSKGCPPRS